VRRESAVGSNGSFGIRAGLKTKGPAELDRLNIITIDTHLDVRPDSMALLRAAREVVEEPDFQEVLDSVRERVDEIESLHRTRELTVWVVACRLPDVGWWLIAPCSSRTWRMETLCG